MNKLNVSHTRQQIPTVKITSFNHNSVLIAFKEQSSQFPKMFKNLPIIIDFSKLGETSGIVAPKQIVLKLAQEVVSGLRGIGVLPIGFIGLETTDCATLGLASFSNDIVKEQDPQEKVTKQRDVPEYEHTKVFRGDFRSGMTVYEENSNLVIIGDVKRGSEVAAGGNIIIFGKLFGKAHAGCKYKNSVVITTVLDPEIVSIEGVFLPNQNFEEKDLNKTAIITIDEERNLVVLSC